MVKRIILAFMFLFPGVSYAEDAVADKSTVAVTQICRQLTAHKPDDDVAYKPGTDQFGREIVPADLDGGSPPIEIPESVLVTITLDQAQILGVPPPAPFNPEAYIGEVLVRPSDGSVFFNGKRLSSAQIQALCDEENP